MTKKQFKAESKQLLNLMINSIYTHKEIFIREIISNASDAIDKLHYKLMTEPNIGITKEDFRIDVSINKDTHSIMVSDNGIGMTKEEMDSNLGIIAHSGSLDFKNSIQNKDNVDIIGQFGVGFYSAFLVSSKVIVRSKAYGQDDAWEWVSEGADGYSIKECNKSSYGTDIIMHIRDDDETCEYSMYLEDYKVKNLIKRYSDYVRWPIHMVLNKEELEETGEKNEDGTPKKEWKSHLEDTVINSMIPIWQRGKDDVSDDDCIKFYKDKFHEWEDPVSVIRVNAEGTVSYKTMLFIPGIAPYNFYSRDFEPGLQLYSSGVLIMDRCKDLLPDCFRFVKGIVDSPDLSLNISREILQHDRQLSIIRSNLEKKIKSELIRLMENEPEKYKKFYKSFGLQLKYGIIENYGTKSDLLKDLIMFYSFNNDKLITLKDYVSSMPENQKKIYYAAADSVKRAKQLPQTEQVRDMGYDILCLTDDADEFVIRTLRNYNEKEFCSVSSNDLGLSSEENEKDVQKKEENEKDILSFIKSTLGDRISSVKLSRKLKTYAVCLGTEGDVSLEMEKCFSNIPGAPDDSKIKAKRVLELNPLHPAFSALKEAYISNKDKAKMMIEIMYYQALLIAGISIDNVLEYSEDVFKLF